MMKSAVNTEIKKAASSLSNPALDLNMSKTELVTPVYSRQVILGISVYIA